MGVHESEVFQGRILFLPFEDLLPKDAVGRINYVKDRNKRPHNHPIVIVSRPKEERDKAHFMLLTSHKETALEMKHVPPSPLELKESTRKWWEIRRTWYLPIHPTSHHPDAVSKKTRKRFPTIILENEVELAKESYVNNRDVYKIDISLLQTYNRYAKVDENIVYQFTRQSLIQMLAKTKSYFHYEPGPQFTGENSTDPVSDEEISNAMADFPEETDPEAMEETSMASSSNREDQTTYASIIAKGEGAVHEDTAGSIVESEVLPPPSDAASQGKEKGKGKGKGKGKKTAWIHLAL